MKKVAATRGQRVSFAMPSEGGTIPQGSSTEGGTVLNVRRGPVGRGEIARSRARRARSYRAEYGSARAMQAKFASHRMFVSRRSSPSPRITSSALATGRSWQTLNAVAAAPAWNSGPGHRLGTLFYLRSHQPL